MDAGTGGRPVPTALATRDDYTCALLSDGTAKCWGDNIYGVLGYGTTNDVSDPASVGTISVAPNPAITITVLSAGWYHVCALLSDTSVMCWGYGKYAELGYGNTMTIDDDELPSSVAPVSITTAPGVTTVGLAGGFLHGCALLTTAAGVTVERIAAGGNHTCAILSDASLKCWGLNGSGQLGYGNTEHIGDDELPSSVGPVQLTKN